MLLALISKPVKLVRGYADVVRPELNPVLTHRKHQVVVPIECDHAGLKGFLAPHRGILRLREPQVGKGHCLDGVNRLLLHVLAELSCALLQQSPKRGSAEVFQTLDAVCRITLRIPLLDTVMSLLLHLVRILRHPRADIHVCSCHDVDVFS